MAGSNAGRAPLGVLLREAEFALAADRPPIHTSDLVIYEMHVRAFTARDNSGVNERVTEITPQGAGGHLIVGRAEA